MRFYQQLLASVRLPDDCFRRYAAHAEDRKYVVTNPYVPADVFRTIYTKALPADAARPALYALRRRNADVVDLLDHVASVERRATVLEVIPHCFDETVLDDDRLAALANATTSVKVLDRLVGRGLDVAVGSSTFDRLSPAGKVAVLADCASDDEVVEWLSTVDTWGASGSASMLSRALRFICNERSELVAALTSSAPGRLATTLAGLRHLPDPELLARHVYNMVDSRFAGLALVHNPVTPLEVVAGFRNHPDHDLAEAADHVYERALPPVTSTFETIDDPTVLQRLLRRCLPNDRYNRPSRVWDLVALAAAPALDTDEDRVAVAEALVDGERDLRVTSSAVDAALDALGVRETFTDRRVSRAPVHPLRAALLPDTWYLDEVDEPDGGTAADLADMRVDRCRGVSASLSSYLWSRFGDDPGSYETLFNLVETVPAGTTWDELVSAVHKLRGMSRHSATVLER